MYRLFNRSLRSGAKLKQASIRTTATTPSLTSSLSARSLMTTAPPCSFLPHDSKRQSNMKVQTMVDRANRLSLSSSSSSSASSLRRSFSTTSASPNTPVLRSDYTPTPYLITDVYLDVVLGEEVTTVTSTLSLKPNPVTEGVRELQLDGRDDMELTRVELNGQLLDPSKSVISLTYIYIYIPQLGS